MRVLFANDDNPINPPTLDLASADKTTAAPQVDFVPGRIRAKLRTFDCKSLPLDGFDWELDEECVAEEVTIQTAFRTEKTPCPVTLAAAAYEVTSLQDLDEKLQTFHASSKKEADKYICIPTEIAEGKVLTICGAEMKHLATVVTMPHLQMIALLYPDEIYDIDSKGIGAPEAHLIAKKGVSRVIRSQRVPKASREMIEESALTAEFIELNDVALSPAYPFGGYVINLQKNIRMTVMMKYAIATAVEVSFSTWSYKCWQWQIQEVKNQLLHTLHLLNNAFSSIVVKPSSFASLLSYCDQERGIFKVDVVIGLGGSVREEEGQQQEQLTGVSKAAIAGSPPYCDSFSESSTASNFITSSAAAFISNRRSLIPLVHTNHRHDWPRILKRTEVTEILCNLDYGLGAD
ncbi:hypothetical protein R3P38DRAFT_2803442 [Favolaschia claudopus]|uniref:Uncharacterized protein n=1 Tax=Favolaschia claudopus TaxID=2862362 RepID=A0AAV9ZRX6_9AGAR